MLSSDSPTQLEKNLSYIMSFFLPPIGIILALVYYFKYPPGLRTLARSCVIVSVASMVICILAVVTWDAFLK